MSATEDRLAIRELVAAYADAVNRRDAGRWGSLWAEDATWDLMGRTVAGRTAIVALWEGAMAGYAFVGFFCDLGHLDLDGDRATGRVWTHETLETTDGTLTRPLGRYDDRYVRVDGQWRFAERRFTLRRS